MPERLQPVKKSNWTFMTNHSHVLVCLAHNPTMLAREIAIKVGITERAVLRILKDLSDTKYLNIIKKGRCNTYTINYEQPLKHPLEDHCSIGSVLELLKLNKNL